jgi:hypothetical protein
MESLGRVEDAAVKERKSLDVRLPRASTVSR